MKSRKELKNEVKDLFKGNWGQAIKLTIIPVILQILLSLLIVGTATVIIIYLAYYSGSSNILNVNNSHSGGGNGFGSPVGSILMSMIFIGINFTFLDWLRTKNADFKALKGTFSVFSKHHFISVLVLYILVSVFTVLWSLLFIIPGIIKSFSYSQTYLIYKDFSVQDTEDVNYLDYITESRKLMDGHKFELFVLKLSFIGWDMLALLTFGIGNIWLVPYKTATYVAFYKNLVEEQKPAYYSELTRSTTVSK
ncbi:DUF975 family protein [Liquorilactobacillus capillatus]|uniref:Integral membrane protein n=1 Tax=Liquorilactobacillus capillatus DSM 19910 TaxID=1423731 RepID=A0A0R1MCF0_9LACO|nr:DUF975 family protein [Liquorilactobacillus capillatus]KRL01064.1 hypothetical protein FC81_GL001586 [Liquorilactobacillus capillatus DSM 19910]